MLMFWYELDWLLECLVEYTVNMFIYWKVYATLCTKMWKVQHCNEKFLKCIFLENTISDVLILNYLTQNEESIRLRSGCTIHT